MATLDEAATHYSCEVSVTFPTKANAAIAQRALEVDEELQPTKIRRTFRHDGPSMSVHFISSDPRVLRVALSSYYDMLTAVVKALREFDDTTIP